LVRCGPPQDQERPALRIQNVQFFGTARPCPAILPDGPSNAEISTTVSGVSQPHRSCRAVSRKYRAATDCHCWETLPRCPKIRLALPIVRRSGSIRSLQMETFSIKSLNQADRLLQLDASTIVSLSAQGANVWPLPRRCLRTRLLNFAGALQLCCSQGALRPHRQDLARTHRRKI